MVRFLLRSMVFGLCATLKFGAGSYIMPVDINANSSEWCRLREARDAASVIILLWQRLGEGVDLDRI